jgi:DNA-directed RNA polymerase
MGCEYWRKADKPFQFLAACFAIIYPEDGARIPIGSDGTANGLQHYSAMLRDGMLGEMVNLTKSDVPQSIYTVVTDAVRKAVINDIKTKTGEFISYLGDDGTRMRMSTSEVAAMALPYAIRKVVKQPVMTDLYGVTPTGARLQVQNVIAEDPGLNKKYRYPIAFYLSRTILASIGDVCKSARNAMQWIRDCAKLICEKDRPVTWITELGLPVVQPHRLMNKVRVETIMQRITLAIDDTNLPICKRRQVDGSAPNLLHSLDSTHMLYTSLGCRNAGIDFIATHDRFFSHAATKKYVAAINRSKFIELHREPYLDKLRSQWVSLHPDIKFPDCPGIGDLDLQQIADSPYFFN